METKYSSLPVDKALYSLAREEVLLKMTIPEYFANHIDESVDLSRTPRCLCPFHIEDTPSFRFNAEKGYWNCFGACKTGGTVIDLHKEKYGIKGHYEALMHLKDTYGDMYNLKFKNFFLDVKNKDLSIEEIINSNKKPQVSVDDFLSTNKKQSLTTLTGKINNELLRLKGKDLDKYIEACIMLDSLFMNEITESEIFNKLLEKLKGW